MKQLVLVFNCFFCFFFAFSQSQPLEYIPAEIDFSEKIGDWDGFGFNYVEAAQSRDYENSPQDYGGFTLLTDKQKDEILQLVFGKDGLQVEIIKMFLDPYHQETPKSAFDHESTTSNMRYFVKKGLEITRQRNDQLEIITTLYGPPPWATMQKHIGGRDLDYCQTENLCLYMLDWVKFLRTEGFPVNYLSLHNEGEDFYRWNFDDGSQRLLKFDYNLHWPPEQVNHFLKELPEYQQKFDLEDLKITNGEPSNWTRFYYWGYTDALYEDNNALNNLGLLTTHGFINGNFRKLSYGLPNQNTTNKLREKKPELHCWITSYSWGDMGIDFIRMAHEHIYTSQVNALIPWAGIQNPSQWVGGDPNPGCAIQINDDGTYEVRKGYYFYKQLTIAGKRGMSVSRATLANPQAFIIAFGKNKTDHPDAFVVASNIFIWSLPIEIKINGTESKRFKAFRSSEDGKEKYKEIGIFEVKDGAIVYDPPQETTTTFIAVD